MSILSNFDLIRRVPLFSMLTDEQAQIIASAVVKQRFRKGALIVESGKKSNALFIILNGRAHVLATDGRGREAILAHLKQGDYIGEMSLIDNLPHSASVRTDVQTDVLVLARAQFAKILPENAAMTYVIMKTLVQRLRHADRKIESLALMDVYGRVANALIEMADLDDEDGLVIRSKVSRQNLAKTVGASREMVSRVMKSFEEKGYFEVRSDGSTLIRNHAFALD